MKINSPIPKGLHSDVFLFWGHVKSYAQPKIKKLMHKPTGQKSFFVTKRKLFSLKFKNNCRFDTFLS